MVCGQAQREPEICPALRQGLQDGFPVGSMEPGPSQRRCPGAGREDHPGHRGARGGGVSGRNPEGPEGRGVLAAACPAAVHSEAGWEVEAIGDTDGTGPSGANGGEARDRADLRGGFRGVQLRIPSREECSGRAGRDPKSGQCRARLGGGCGHREVLRQHRP